MFLYYVESTTFLQFLLSMHVFLKQATAFLGLTLE